MFSPVVFVLVAFLPHTVEGASATPFLNIVQERLRQLAPNAEGKLWKLTKGNTLKADWLLQTPNCWGDDDPNTHCARNNTPGTHVLAAQMRDDISSATEWVDVTTLADGMAIATGIFHEAIVAGIRQARVKHPNVTFRIVGGTPPTKSNGMSAAYMARLLKDLGSAADGARIFVAALEPWRAYSWNHAKMVAVDGKTAIVGGHNLYDEAYNGDHPVNDVSMRLGGPAASMAHKMADLLWNFTCSHVNDSDNVGLALSPAIANGSCPDHFSHKEPSAEGAVSVLSMGMLGFGMPHLDNVSGALKPVNDSEAACSSVYADDFNELPQFSVDNPDLEARRALIRAAKKHVFIAQQDLVFDYCSWWNSAFVSATYDARLFDAIAQKLQEGVLVTIVVSTPEDKGDTAGYSYMKKLNEISDILLRKLRQQNMSVAEANATVCRHLKLASVRIAHNFSKWESGVAMGQHAKVFAVDDAAFYIGSHNLYPTTLQEFGYLVEDASAAQHFKVSFLDKLWKYSRESAIVDAEAGKCDIGGGRLHSSSFGHERGAAEILV